MGTHFLPCSGEHLSHARHSHSRSESQEAGREGADSIPQLGFSDTSLQGVLDPATASAGTKGMEPCFVWGIRVKHFSAASLLGL